MVGWVAAWLDSPFCGHTENDLICGSLHVHSTWLAELLVDLAVKNYDTPLPALALEAHLKMEGIQHRRRE